MEMRSVVPRDHSPSHLSSAPSRSSALTAPNVAGGPLLPRLAAASHPGREGAASATGRSASVSREDAPRWFAEYRLRFTCDLDVLDEKH
jgi:hypothetical protein